MSNARENKLHRQLSNKFGYILRKSRRRTIDIDNFCEYQIIDAYTNTIVAGEKFNLSLDDVEQFIFETEKEQGV